MWKQLLRLQLANEVKSASVPLFHAAGLYTSIMAIVYWDISVAFGPASRPVSADLVAESLAKLEVQGAVLPPSVLEDMSQDETGIRVLSRLNFVAFGGSTYPTACRATNNRTNADNMS